jgi:hypothetical protein
LQRLHRGGQIARHRVGQVEAPLHLPHVGIGLLRSMAIAAYLGIVVNVVGDERDHHREARHDGDAGRGQHPAAQTVILEPSHAASCRSVRLGCARSPPVHLQA